MREPEVRKAKPVWVPKRNGVGPPFRFRRGWASRQAFVLLGVRVKANRRSRNRNETGVFRGVTGKPSGLAPPNTVTNRRDPFNFNGLRAVKFATETVFLESRSPVASLRTTHVQNGNGERRLPDALSPSCLLDSTDLLQMSRRKMLQAVGVTDDSVDPRSWPTTPATSATQWYDPPLIRH